MPLRPTRRGVLSAASVLAAGTLLPRPACADDGVERPLGPAEPFGFERLKAEARALAAEPFRPAPPRAADVLDAIDYDGFQTIRFNEAATVRAGPFPIRFFHLHRYAKEPVRVFLIEQGRARELLYRPDYFRTPPGHPARRLPDDIGFAGFRVMNPEGETDWLAFMGASYFRAPSPEGQFGLSARGVAVDIAMPTAEEFPRFTRFYLEAAPGEPERLHVYAFLDGPSLTGAYRFDIAKRTGVVMDIEAELNTRAAVHRLGIAPLTSMFWYAEYDRPAVADWRPEIHDSDGLAIWTGAGERIWRPLNNPRAVMTNSFLDKDPKGFGLLQRDRNFDHYQDDGVFYDRRPSVYVEPLHAWGEGTIQLVEIPTDDEVHDNIVAYWVPGAPVGPHETLNYRYRLHWLSDEPYPANLGRTVDTRTGMGGIPAHPRPKGVHKFTVDFEGGGLDKLTRSDGVEAVVTASRGEIDNVAAFNVVSRPRFRAQFDLHAEGSEPVNLRLYLRRDGKALTETWLFQYLPPPSAF